MATKLCGVDPGLSVVGYAVLSCDNGTTRVVDAGLCRSEPKAALAVRLAQLEADFQELLVGSTPAVVAVEQLYAHYRHPRTAIMMGHARGVLLSVAARLGIEVRHYPATQVKRFLTGNGRASKGQVQRAITAELGLPTVPRSPDVADALAIALCCAHDLCKRTAPIEIGGSGPRIHSGHQPVRRARGR